jgi:hypothetical protein
VVGFREHNWPKSMKICTQDSLIRVVRRLVRGGAAEADLLRPALRKMTNDHLVTLVAGIAGALEKPTLAVIAAQLEKGYVRTPRGGSRWSPSSVKNLLDRARAQGLIPAP